MTKTEANFESITLTFTGDIMAHTNVTRMTDFSKIYEDIKDITLNDDLTFANMETPVIDSQNYESWPTFNVKNAYVMAAVDAGINVFTLANNHTNDQGLEGINATRDFFDSLKDKDVYSCGLKKKENDDFTYQLIEKNGFKILFMGVTEIYNSTRFIEWFDTTDRSETSRKSFIERVTQMRKDHPCDIFVLAFHCNEPEYVIPVTERRKKYYHSLLDAGVDVIWANHPHVMQEYEVVKSLKNPQQSKLILYSVGNLISGQRFKRNYEEPEAMREYTGESFLVQLTYKKSGNLVFAEKPEFTILTNHTEGPAGLYDTFIRKLDEDFIKTLPEMEQVYYRRRLELCNQITGKTIWN
ncbi:MAG: CapA family protein [Treponemataceae bacterium]|nr:CapA family protein [Treponemataceae bacterium]